MSETAERLFDVDAYSAPERQIPFRLGFRPGEFDDNRTQYVNLSAYQGPIYQRSEKKQDFRSMTYAADSLNFNDEFHYWQPVYEVREQEYTGYAVGCPIISMPDGKTELALHIWSNNSDVLIDTYAVPLANIKSI